MVQVRTRTGIQAGSTTVRFPKRLHKDLKIAAARSGVPIQTFVEQLFVRSQRSDAGPPETDVAEALGKVSGDELEMAKAVIALMRDRANPAHGPLVDALRGLVGKYATASHRTKLAG